MDIKNKFNNKELYTRKKVSAFIEKQFRFDNFDFQHDIYKKIVYSENEYRTPIEEMLKNYYDAFMYLVTNDKSVLSQSLIKKFHYILKESEIDEGISITLSSKYFYLCDYAPIEKAITYHMIVYEELNNYLEYERRIIALCFLNYILIKHNIPMIKFSVNDLSRYVEARDKYLKGDKNSLFVFFLEMFSKNLFLDKSYSENLREITTLDIINVIKEEKETIVSKYKVKEMFIYGSFVKGDYRIDSDIDMLASLSDDLLNSEKINNINKLKDYLTSKFDRYVDIQEVNKYLNDEFIKEVTSVKKVI